MPRDPNRLPDQLVGGTIGMVAVLIVAVAVIPIVFNYIVALSVLAIVVRVVWFFTSGRW
jgi:hypothetical protein